MIAEPELPLAIDAAAGRAAHRAELRRRLLTAPPAYLDGALGNPQLGGDELLLLLRNRRASESILTRVAQNASWLRKAEVRRLLVQHPRVPLALARELVGRLGWKDLLEVSVGPHVHPVARRQAERLLLARLEELSSGERVTLARRAPRAVLAPLILTDDPRVLESALGNPALTEPNAVEIARAARSGAEVLQRMAAHPRWGVRQSVRAALLGNARTPVPVALRLVMELPRRELRRLVAVGGLPRIVHVAAERRLEAGGAM